MLCRSLALASISSSIFWRPTVLQVSTDLRNLCVSTARNKYSPGVYPYCEHRRDWDGATPTLSRSDGSRRQIAMDKSTENCGDAGPSSLQTNIQKFISSNHVAVFSKSWCPYCKKAKSLFEELGVTYKAWELDLDAQGDLIQTTLLELSGQKTVPNIYINQKHIGGFSDLNALRDAGALKSMLDNVPPQPSSGGLSKKKTHTLESIKEAASTEKILIVSKSDTPDLQKAKALLRSYEHDAAMLLLDDASFDQLKNDFSSEWGSATLPKIFLDNKIKNGLPELLDSIKNGELAELLGKNSLLVPDQRPHEELIADFISKYPIAIFSKSWCPFCAKAKTLLESSGLNFQAIELDLREDGVALQAKMHEFSGQKTVPNIFINGKHVGGFDNLSGYSRIGLLKELAAGQNLDFDYDLVVIGGGSGGISAAKEAAAAKKKVALCDFVTPSPRGTIWGLGGTCVNVGCIPKKLMHRAALILQDIKDSIDFGWKLPSDILEISHCWSTLVDNVQKYITSLNDQYVETLRESNVTYYNAKATFVDRFTVRLVGKDGMPQTIKARNFIVAVGGRPTPLDLPNADDLCVSSDDLFQLKTAPGKTLVVGASYIALECAGFLRGLGYDVTVMVRSILLRGFDQEIADKIEKHMAAYGVRFLKKCVPSSIEKAPDGTEKILVKGKFDDGSLFEGEYDTVLTAVGRTALTSELNLDSVGIKTNPRNKKIIVNEADQTSIGNIFAIGDVIERPELTPVAIQAGKLLAKRLYGKEPVESNLMDYTNIPTTVFTPLEYGSVGLSEETAIATHGKDNIEVYHSTFRPLETALRTWGTEESAEGFAKLVCLKDNKDLRVIGLHILSPNAGEITQGFSFGVKLKLKKSEFDNLVGIHPTVAEVFTTMKVTKSSGEDSSAKGC